MKKHFLSLLLLAWIVAVIGIGLQRTTTLSALLDGNGPLALASDSKGNVWLATRDTLYLLDADERLQQRTPAATIGLTELNSVAVSRDGGLWIFDSEKRQVFRCRTTPLACAPFGPSTLQLDRNVQIAETASGELLLSDNDNQRVVRLSANGLLLDDGKKFRRHYPNQIAATENGVLLANTDRRRILQLPDDAAAEGEIALATDSRPYRFVRRGDEWWVIEAGITLENGVVRYYHKGATVELPLDIEDPSAIIDNGRRLIITGLQDWRLISLDPATGDARPVNDPQLQKEFSEQRELMANARKEQDYIPLLMIAFMLPAFGGGILLQRRIDRDKAVNTSSAPIVTERHIATSSTIAAGQTAGRAAHRATRIEPDISALEAAFSEQNRLMLRAGMIVIPLTLLMFGIMWLVLGSESSQAFRIILPILAILFFIPLFLLLQRRQQRRQFDQHFICGQRKLVHVIASKPRKAIAYEDIWLGDNTLVLGSKLIPLYRGHGRHRHRFWPVSDIQREVGQRIPLTQTFDNDFLLGRALLRHQPLLGLRLIMARFAVGIAIGIVLLLKLAEVVSHFGLLKLLKLSDFF
ncbi:MAG: hypothetical protein Q8J78_06095 [Moraxellaceae bacterium]|nr:hypothetical protein [Moraxellaceae bacterium]